MTEGTWTIESCARDSVAMLARELELSPTTAAVLVRRGYEDVARAKAFLEGALPAHEPLGLGDMAEACEAIRDAIAGGRRICVHGDYDADGICRVGSRRDTGFAARRSRGWPATAAVSC